MTIHGVGSLNSPIVISDDEDEAYVELELEQRLSSPRESMELEFDDDFQDDYSWQDNITQEDSYRNDLVQDEYADDVTPNGRMPHGTPRLVSRVSRFLYVNIY